MPAPLLSVDPSHPHARSIERVAEVLRAGGLIAYPSGTGYGIGCDLSSKKAIDRLYALKRRDRQKPFAILCPDLSDVARYGMVSKFAYRTMRQLAPGPFTFVLAATRLVPEMMTTKQKQVGIRIPSLAWPQALLAALGRPLVNSSAADPEEAALLDAQDIRASMGRALELIVDGGVQSTEPSTVISLIGDEIEVIRQGRGVLPGLAS
jgi:tRNA threonylcarbamoyl adenosine modification protein (Sua5/YciO/YrdC/YwlC family)